LFEDVFDNCHGDVWCTVDFVFHSEPLHRLFCEAFSSFLSTLLLYTSQREANKNSFKSLESSFNRNYSWRAL
jgi:hypothetical protein